MATSWTPTPQGAAVELRPEERGFLVAGPGRAAEVAIVSLVEAGAARISRDGLVSAVRTNHRSWTPLQAVVLRSTPRSMGDVVSATADSEEAAALHLSLIERGYLTTVRRRRMGRWGPLLVFLAMFTVLATLSDHIRFEHAVGVFVTGALLFVLLHFAGRPQTASGRAEVKRLKEVATTANRVALVAYYGLLGEVARVLVWQLLGMAPEAARTLRRRRPTSSGSGCGSWSDSSGGDGDGGGE
ncbi:TIGR04222 domain-containing membrane protein [Actinosynnema sp. CS-041913]|uniref:TIGR04222 domain-containing membrane protein n=1 Tax=Actinosynnema sp. CS-041913 TaxID=3239917 RepID=UPI003D8E8819